MSPWRNRLARSAVNRKVGGSSPPGDDFISTFPRNLTSRHMQLMLVNYRKRKISALFRHPFVLCQPLAG